MTGSLTFSTHRRPNRRRWVRVVVVVVVVAVIALVLVVLTGGLLWGYAWARLGGTNVPALADEDHLGTGGATAPDGTTTVLVALTQPHDPTEPGDAPLAGPVALLQVGGPRADGPIALLLPSQLHASVDGEAPMPLGQVHATGGVDLLVRTVVDYTQIDVDHVVTASTAVVPDLVDALGPLEVCRTACRSVDAAGAEGTIATYTDTSASSADVADAFAEVTAILRTLGEATDATSAVASPFATRRAIDVVAAGVVTDASLRGAALLPLAARLADTGAGDVAVVPLPGFTNPDSGELLVLPEQAATRFALLREGGAPTATPEDDEAALLADAAVSVQNGTGTAGYAATLQTQLEALGVRVVGTENAVSFDVERTQVAYGPDDPVAEAVAVLLARDLGDVELVPLDRVPTFEGEPVTVQVIGGADLDSGADAPTDQEP